MNNKARKIKQQQDIDLLLWKEFQDGLSTLMEVPMALYDSSANLVTASGARPGVCNAFSSSKKGRKFLCREHCVKAVAESNEKGKSLVSKCHANQYIFTVPFILDRDTRFVLVGGHCYVEPGVDNDFYKGVKPLDLDEGELKRLRAGVKVISRDRARSLAGAVLSLASPFLKCLFAKRGEGNAYLSGGSNRDWAKSFRELEQVYAFIGTLKDEEKLYDAILNKSMELVRAGRGSLMLLDNATNVLTVKAANGLDRALLKRIKVKCGVGIAGMTAQNGHPVMAVDVENEMSGHRCKPKYKTKSFISIPLKFDGRVMGVINFADKVTGEPFSREDLVLLQSVAGYASIALERGSYYSMNEELKTLSMTDPLTALFNRRYFHERLFEEVERYKRHSECFSVFMIDIDDFKGFNDRYGHIAGDEVLCRTSRAVRDAVRSMDVVARYGGEEIAVILPHTAKKDAVVIAERVRQGVVDMKNTDSTYKELPTVSVGVSEYPADGKTVDSLIDSADRAMYSAKRLGKNRVIICEG